MRWIERGRPAVLALGGGAFVAARQPRAAREQRRHRLAGLPVRDRRSGASRQATHRPLARDPETLRRPLRRAPRTLYAWPISASPVESDDPAVTVDAILAHPISPNDRRNRKLCAATRSPSFAPRWPPPTPPAPSRATSRARNLDRFRHIYVIGAGKAGASMAQAAERVLGRRITAGLINVKDGHLAKLRRIELNECGHPVPDERGVAGARAHRRNRRRRRTRTTWCSA